MQSLFFFVNFAIWIIVLNFVNDGCIWRISYNFQKYSDSHWDLLECFCPICLWTDFQIYFFIFLCVSNILDCNSFWILKIAIFLVIILLLIFIIFCSEFYYYHFYFYFCRFGWSMISCNHKTTKLFGGVHVCVFGLF